MRRRAPLYALRRASQKSEAKVTIILGLVGPSGVGKTSAAMYLEEAYGASVWAIADDLKLVLADMFLLSREQLHGKLKEVVDPRWGATPRQLMRRQGDALRRVFGDIMQIEKVLDSIRQELPELAVITDVRYPHEADYIRDHRGLLWRIEPPPGASTSVPDHSSETAYTSIDVDLVISPVALGRSLLHHEVDRACARTGLLPKIRSAR